MKLGFACKYPNNDGKQFFPFRATTRKRFLSLLHDERNRLIYEISVTNLNHLYLTLEHLVTLPEPLRIMRIGSDLLPLYTVPEATPLFKAFLPELYPLFARCDELARTHQIRFSFHPGQYTVLASDNPDVVIRALGDVEYHALCACLMGYGKRFQDFEINIHMNGKAGFDGFKRSFGQLSPEARLMLTVENDEISCSLDDVLQAAALCPVVLDIHHHSSKENQFIQPEDARIAEVIASWRDVRPVLHYLVSQEGIIPQQGWPDQQQLGVAKSKLRAHSDYYFNPTLNDWALSFQDFDIMCEVKMKNLAREQLYLWAKQQQRIA